MTHLLPNLEREELRVPQATFKGGIFMREDASGHGGLLAARSLASGTARFERSSTRPHLACQAV